MYKLKELSKTAGTKMPKDKGAWTGEILKSLMTQHPYIDTSKIKVEFSRIDSETGNGSGKITINGKGVIPFFIRENQKTRSMELDPLDILFDGENYKSLNESSLSDVMDESSVSKKKNSTPNDYVGYQTGDVSPMQWNYTGAGFASSGAGRMTTASCGLLGVVIRNAADLDRLQLMAANYPNMAARTGINDSLDEILKDTPVSTDNNVCVITWDGVHMPTISYGDGNVFEVDMKDLKLMLHDDYHSIKRLLKSKGWATVRDLPVLKDCRVPKMSVVDDPIKYSGKYIINGVPAVVFTESMDWDGTHKQYSKAVFTNDLSCLSGRQMYGRFVGDFNCSLPVGTIDVGKVGFFVSEAWGTAQATPTIEITQIIDGPGEDDFRIHAKDMQTGGIVGLVPLPSIVKPQRIPSFHRKEDMPEFSYYIPGHMTFVEINGLEKTAERREDKDPNEKVFISKNANSYMIIGSVQGKRINDTVKGNEVIFKLANLGVDDDAINMVMNSKESILYNLVDLSQKPIEKKSSFEIPQYFKIAAEEAAQAVNESQDITDPQVNDAVMAMQFISEENLRDVLGYKNVFEDVEDKLARLVLAARQGEESISEDGVSRALKGMGTAVRSLNNLAIELDERES